MSAACTALTKEELRVHSRRGTHSHSGARVEEITDVAEPPRGILHVRIGI